MSCMDLFKLIECYKGFTSQYLSLKKKSESAAVSAFVTCSTNSSSTRGSCLLKWQIPCTHPALPSLPDRELLDMDNIQSGSVALWNTMQCIYYNKCNLFIYFFITVSCSSEWAWISDWLAGLEYFQHWLGCFSALCWTFPGRCLENDLVSLISPRHPGNAMAGWICHAINARDKTEGNWVKMGKLLCFLKNTPGCGRWHGSIFGTRD